MEVLCENCGHPNIVNHLGRKRGNYPVQLVLNAYRSRIEGGSKVSIGILATETGLSKGTTWRILKGAKINYVGNKTKKPGTIDLCPTK